MKHWRWVCIFAVLLLHAMARAQPAPVTIGVFVNKIQDLNFRENKYTLDFFIWFRWKAEGELADYQPLESFEIINGRIDSKTSVIEKKIRDVNYASARISATISDTWNLTSFPFDWHRNEVRIENSVYTSDKLQFVADQSNSRLGAEIDMPGWDASRFDVKVVERLYRTNYGDISLPTEAESVYSRFIASWEIRRTGWGGAVKLLLTVFLATAVAFVAFLVRPSDLDARFGMGVGALFAVVASSVVVSSATPDSGTMTLADQIHLVALAFIFTTLLLSAYGLHLELSDKERRAAQIDHWSISVLPVLFFGWAVWAIWRAVNG